MTLCSLAPSLLLVFVLPVQDDPGEPTESARSRDWIKQVDEDSQRGTLRDAFEKVRGDSGKWNDDPQLQVAPSTAHKPQRTSLDDWFDQLTEDPARLTADDETWVLFKTAQLDDNDRVWIERIERRGNRFTINMSQAVWQGRYQKTFTFYNVYGVNLGELSPGEYKVTWVIDPLVFERFAGNGRPLDPSRVENWPSDPRADDTEPIELSSSFQVTMKDD